MSHLLSIGMNLLRNLAYLTFIQKRKHTVVILRIVKLRMKQIFHRIMEYYSGNQQDKQYYFHRRIHIHIGELLLRQNDKTEQHRAVYYYADYSQNQSDSKIKTFPNPTAEMLSLFGNARSPLVASDPTDEITGSFETYVVVDYDPALCGYNDNSGFFLTGNLGKDYTLFDDYEFILEVAQA